MHELGIALEIIKSVEAEKLERNMKTVSEIGLKIGALSSINPESLRFCFESSRKDTSLADTHLEIEHIAVEGRCSSCKYDFKVKDFIFVCPQCGSNEIEIIKGNEMHISYIVGE
jgi:hydrogenase nickel incorporation protein HypA/HybF